MQRINIAFRNFIVLLFIVPVIGLNAQVKMLSSKTVQVFHAPKSVLKYQTTTEPGKLEVLVPEGSVITVQIENPNYLRYQYATSLKEIEINHGLPDLSELIAGLNGLNVESLTAASAVRSGGGTRGVPPLCDESMLRSYVDKVNTLKGDIENVKDIMLRSESTEHNLEYYIAQINAVSANAGRFNDPKLEDNLIKTIESGVCDARIVEALKSEAKYYAKTVAEIRAKLKTSQTFSYNYKVGKKRMTITVIARPLEGVTPLRQIDTIATLVIHPYITSTWELIPTLNFVWTKPGKKYSVEDGLIVEESGEEITPRLGMFLVRNIWNWGTYKEVRTGLGVGFAVRPIKDQNVLDNLYAGVFTNIADQVKLGLGIGWAQIPTGLDGAKPGDAMPTNVSSLDDITKYSRSPAAFLSITIFGFEFKKK